MARSPLPLFSLSLSSHPVHLSNAQCISAPLATPIPVSDDPSSPVATPCDDLSDSPSTGLPPMPYSVPVSEHMEECSVIPRPSGQLAGGQLHLQESQRVTEPSPWSYPHQPPQHSCGPAPSILLQPPRPSYPLPSSASLSARCPPWSPTPLWARGTRPPHRCWMPWGPFPQGLGTQRAKEGLELGGWTHSEYTLPGGRISHSFIPGIYKHRSPHTNALLKPTGCHP
uniref:Uncharacterized protein n=1 Tax=Hucho hucho TaxID=62062 RepID=A0A4W5R4P3_9TELE